MRACVCVRKTETPFIMKKREQKRERPFIMREKEREGERGKEREEAISWRLLRNDFGLLATVESPFV